MARQCVVVKRSSRILIDAIRRRDTEGMAKLLEYGNNAIAIDYDGNSPVHHAIFADNAKILELLLKNGAEVDAVNNAGLRPYNIAVELKKFPYIEMLLKYKAQINIDDFGCRQNEFPKELINAFYEHVDVNDVSLLGYTALHYAVKRDDLNGVRLLIRKGADVNKPSVYEGYTPLHLAKSANCIELLLHKGAEPNIKDRYACTPLYTTAVTGKFGPKSKMTRVEQSRMIRILYENGADGIDVVYAGQVDLDFGRDWSSMDGLRDVLKYMALLEERGRYDDKMKLRPNEEMSELSTFYDKCLAEVAILKDDVIYGGRSLYGFVTRSVKDLIYCVCNRKMLDVFEERRELYRAQFPIYYEILEQHFSDAIERRNLLDAASLSLCNIVQGIDVSHIVTQTILDYLTMEDMRSLITACQVPIEPETLYN